MTDIASFVPLPARGLIEVSGADARSFLQGLISNDVEKATPERAIYAALLSPQGKFLHDFIIAAHGEGLLLDCERARLPDLGQRLAGYKLRARVTLADASDDMRVAAAFGEEALARLGLAREAGACRPLAAGFSCVDPRDQKLGARVYLPAEAGMTPLTELGFVAAPSEQYEALRLKLGVPDGSRDMTIDKATLLENNFEALHGVDFSKGCYVGQELTARTKYRGLVKRRLTRVRIDGPPPPPGAPLTIAGKEAGEMRTALPGFGLALLRLDRLEETNDTPLESGVARLWPLREGDSQG